jgi:hypothetical protein
LNGGISWFLIRKQKRAAQLLLKATPNTWFWCYFNCMASDWSIHCRLNGLEHHRPHNAFVVAALIIRMGLGLVFKSCSRLMDNSCKEEEARFVMYYFAINTTSLTSMTWKLAATQLGFCELHLSVDGSLIVAEAHDLTDHLENELKEELPNANQTIHVEPKKPTQPPATNAPHKNQTTSTSTSSKAPTLPRFCNEFLIGSNRFALELLLTSLKATPLYNLTCLPFRPLLLHRLDVRLKYERVLGLVLRFLSRFFGVVGKV